MSLSYFCGRKWPISWPGSSIPSSHEPPGSTVLLTKCCLALEECLSALESISQIQGTGPVFWVSLGIKTHKSGLSWETWDVDSCIITVTKQGTWDTKWWRWHCSHPDVHCSKGRVRLIYYTEPFAALCTGIGFTERPLKQVRIITQSMGTGTGGTIKYSIPCFHTIK